MREALRLCFRQASIIKPPEQKVRETSWLLSEKMKSLREYDKHL